MGGEGSGRKPDVLKSMLDQQAHRKTILATDGREALVIPNYSGIQKAALKTSAPLGSGSGTPGGSDRQVQFNDAGAFGGNSGFIYTSGGVVGINVAVPDTNSFLHLSGGLLVLDGFNYHGLQLRTGGTDRCFIAQETTGDCYIGTQSAMNFRTGSGGIPSGTNRMTIGSTGAITFVVSLSGANIETRNLTGAQIALSGTLTGASVYVTGDQSTADKAYVPMVLYNTDITPPTASDFPIGTLYVQYVA